jgi:hypothetical protein
MGDFLVPRRFPYLALVVVLVVGLAAVLLERYVGTWMQITELTERDLAHYACGATKYDGLKDVDVSAPISVGRFEYQPRSEDEKTYIAEIDKLAAAHAPATSGARYVLHTSFVPPPGGSTSAVTASLCLSGEAKKCRIRNFELHDRLAPALAARIVFEDIVGPRTSLRKCYVDPRHESKTAEPEP